ncbi:MAG: TonB-dependent receptor, partial [Prevotellaceae bacterium]|nr:TonB-dependent receptor [Prevotellaceae bacterium]
MKRLLLSAFLLCSVVFILQAQVTTSSMSGKVVTGNEPVIGATVQAVHEPSGTLYGAATNIEGRFSLQGMRTGGPYKVTISFIGFQTVVVEGITLKLGENYQVDADMKESAALLDEVIITGTRSKLGNERTGATTNVNNREITTLPSINRSIVDYTRLSPYSGSGRSFGGRDGRLNNITIDGANFNNYFGLNDALPGGGNPISIDAIEELQVTIAPFDVRQANFVGAGINAITKSGTNTFKGSVYTYLRNQDLRGNKVDGTYLGTPFEEKTNIYGFTLGGPIIKNKLFFFVNAEKEESPGQTTTYRVSEDGQAVENRYSRTTAADMDAFANVLKNTYGYDPGSYTNFPGGTTNNKILARLDWNINDAHKLTVRYNYTKNQTWIATNGNSAPRPRAAHNRISEYSMAFSNNVYSMDNTVASVTGELNSRLGNSLSNQILATYTNIEDMRGSNSAPFPHVDIWKEGDIFMSAGYELFTWNNGVKNKVITVADNLTYTLGNHKLTGGVSYENQYVSNAYMRYATGYYRFASFDDFQTGKAPIAFGLTYGYGGNLNPVSELSFGQWSAYAQDEWNVSDRLKATYGIRADLNLYLNDLAENTAISAETFLDGQRINTGLWPKSRVLLSPRIGLNWDVFGDKSLKVSYGMGIFTGRIPLVFFTNMPTNAGMIQNTIGENGLSAEQYAKLMPNGKMLTDVNEIVQALGLPNQPAQQLPSSTAAVDRNFKLPQVWKMSLAVDWQAPVDFPLNFRLEGMYSKDINAMVQKNINVMDVEGLPQFAGPDNRYIYPGNKGYYVNSKMGDVMLLQNTNKGYGYNLNFMVNTNPVENLNLMLSYTYTVVKEVSGNPGNQAASAWNNQPTVNGANQYTLQNSQYVTPHKVIGSLTYRIPDCSTWKGTSIGIYYTGYNPGRYSYMYSNDMNGDEVIYDLMYIPASKNDISFVDITNTGGEVLLTAAEQADAFWNFVEQDSYLSKHKGEYAEAFSAVYPWVNRFDVKLTKDFYVNVGKTKNTLQLTFDILNIGNLLNSSWGVTKNSVISNP